MSHQNGMSDCPVRMSGQIILSECPSECPIKMSYQNELLECFIRMHHQLYLRMNQSGI